MRMWIDVPVATGFVTDAMSKTVSSVIAFLRRLQGTMAVRFAEDHLIVVQHQHDRPGAAALGDGLRDVGVDGVEL